MNFRGTKTTVLVKQQSSYRYKNNMVQKQQQIQNNNNVKCNIFQTNFFSAKLIPLSSEFLFSCMYSYTTIRDKFIQKLVKILVAQCHAILKSFIFANALCYRRCYIKGTKKKAP